MALDQPVPSKRKTLPALSAARQNLDEVHETVASPTLADACWSMCAGLDQPVPRLLSATPSPTAMQNVAVGQETAESELTP
jgi:hypothetical protein